ncbi:hypothetical protein [Vibrio atlanticus]|uniref:DUF2079 domain-containing protein n=1 Tax=Vibrio atlanticus (strain LGP32) TaxID=575788 RepID=B7VS79_VIBA3|nr:hypothetical protein [Vibrio atlanticus]CAV26993.1 Hypothetical protein VS_II1099 [Vibrio atlanticus]
MNLKSAVDKIKRVYKIAAGTLLFAIITVGSLYMGWVNIVKLGQPIGDVETYSRFDLALIPMGAMMFIVLIISIFYVITEERWEDRYSTKLPLYSLGFAALAILLTLATPYIYESKYEKAGLQECTGTPVGYMPFFGKKFAVEPSLCRK